MRTRCSARLLVLDASLRVLLFRFTHKQGALSGQDYWATPGGGLEPGESFEDAAVRELREETGIQIDRPGPVISLRKVRLQLPDGEWVLADERYFLIRVADEGVVCTGWTDLERELMSAFQWWTMAELKATTQTIWPRDLADILAQAQREGPWET